MRRFLISASFLFCYCLPLCCSPDKGTVEVYLVRSPLEQEDPLDTSLVTHLRIRVTGPGMEPIEDIFSFASGESSTLSEIPVGKDRVITVEGLTSLDGYAISRGRSLPLKISDGSLKIDLFIARVGRFSLAPGDGLSEPRFGHAAVSSDRGKLFLLGGAASGSPDAPGSFLSSVEVYDPTSGSIEYAACEGAGRECLMHPRSNAAGVAVDDGILVIGGAGPKGTESDIELFDIESGQVEQTGLKSEPRHDAAVFFLGGRSVVAGGVDADGAATEAVEIVDRHGVISRTTLPEPRYAMAAAPSLGKGFLFGGFDKTGKIASGFFVFDANSGGFLALSSESEARAWSVATPLPDGRVLVAGGVNSDGEVSSSVDLYDPTLNLLCKVGTMQLGRWLSSAVALDDGRVLVIGGLTGLNFSDATSETEMLDPRFVEIDGNCGRIHGELGSYRMPGTRMRRFSSSATLMQNGTVAVAGGLDPDLKPVAQMEIFVPDE